MTADPQTMFVVEYPCDKFCRIELDVTRERRQATLQELLQQAERLHRQEHEPEISEPETPVADPEAARRPASTVFLSAPGRGRDQRR